jgi:hypothetical protein
VIACSAHRSSKKQYSLSLPAAATAAAAAAATATSAASAVPSIVPRLQIPQTWLSLLPAAWLDSLALRSLEGAPRGCGHAAGRRGSRGCNRQGEPTLPHDCGLDPLHYDDPLRGIPPSVAVRTLIQQGSHQGGGRGTLGMIKAGGVEVESHPRREHLALAGVTPVLLGRNAPMHQAGPAQWAVVCMGTCQPRLSEQSMHSYQIDSVVAADATAESRQHAAQRTVPSSAPSAMESYNK